MSASYDPNHVTKLGELYDFLTGIWAKCKNMFAAKSDLATVATSGSYNDLSNKPDMTDYVEHSVVCQNWVSGEGHLRGDIRWDNGKAYQSKNIIPDADDTTAPHLDPTNWEEVKIVEMGQNVYHLFDGTNNGKPTISTYEIDKYMQSGRTVYLVSGTSLYLNNQQGEIFAPVFKGGLDYFVFTRIKDDGSGMEVWNSPNPRAQGSTWTKTTVSLGTVRDVTVDGASVVSNGVAALNSITVDQTYNKNSTHAQSGVAIEAELSAHYQKKIVVLTYGTSSFSDFTSALNDNAVIFVKDSSNRYAVLTNSNSNIAVFQTIQRTSGDSWKSRKNAILYRYTLQPNIQWNSYIEPVGFTPHGGNGILLSSDETSRVVTFNVDIPVYTSGSNSLLYLGSSGILAKTSAFSSTSVTNTFTSEKGGMLVYAANYTSDTTRAIGNQYSDNFMDAITDETVTAGFVGGAGGSVTFDSFNAIKWNGSGPETIPAPALTSLDVKLGLFSIFPKGSSTSYGYTLHVEPTKILDFGRVGILQAGTPLTVPSCAYFSPASISNVTIEKGSKLATMFYSEYNGVRYFYIGAVNPYGSTSLSIVYTRTTSAVTLVEEAPSDNKEYVRKNGAWSEASIPPAQVQSDWDQSDSSAPDYIKNKPSIPTVPVQDVEYNGTSVVNAQGVAEIPAPSYPVTDVTLDGTSVVSNGVAALTKEVFYLTMSNDPDADKALIDTAVAAGKAVILKYVDGQYTWELPLVIYKPTEIYRFCNNDYYRFVSVSLKYSSSAWTWENIFKKVVCPNYSSSDAGSVLTVNSAGTATVWDPLATTAEIQAIVV